MAYKILYVEDQKTDSRELDLKALGFEVESYDPSSDLSEILGKLNNIDALILDYRLTNGEKHACFDAPTIAATLRSKHTTDFKERPIILMSNEDVIVDYYKDFTNQDLFDFAISKKDFLGNKEKFKNYLTSFVEAYSKIKTDNFDLLKIFQINSSESGLIHTQIKSKLKSKEGFIYEHSRLINDTIINAIGTLIGEDILAARLGISKDSKDWAVVLDSLKDAKYFGIFSDIHSRWWMDKVNFWWENVIEFETPLRRLNAEERVNVIKTKLSLDDLNPSVKTEYSTSSNFWTICKFSNKPLDPFDGIELLKKDYLPWQEKEYISFDSALTEIEKFKNIISEIDKKAIRELANKVNTNG
ncbi:response regulator [Flavobacterium sp.]|uniref:response regulator n=1 Tax=Flavobacterium sp. TaxID=239 RepID=UPI00261E5BF5|nr:response regulator [Flavobacterium sp.]